MIERLLRQAHLFDDPGAYVAGVRDAVDALVATGALPEAVAGQVEEAARAA